MLDHAATSAIAPAGSDLRVVANVRMVTPGRRVAALRVAMRVTVTDEDEDLRTVERAVKQAVRTLALVALLVAALAAGAAAHRGASPGAAAAGGGLIVHAAEAAPPGEVAPGQVSSQASSRVSAGQVWRSDASPDRAADHGDRPDGLTCAATACAAGPAVGVLPAAAPAPAAAAGPSSTVAAESDRLPRPALAARVVPSPD